MVLAGLLATMLLAGCAGADVDPAPSATPTPTPEPASDVCEGTVHWSAGSMAPPHSHSWELTLAGDTADFVVSPSFTGEESYRDEGFAVDEDAARDLCLAFAEVADEGEDRQMDGGPTLTWDLGRHSGYSTVPSSFGEARDRAVDVIGQDRFDEGIAAYEAWRDAQDG